MAKPRLTKKDYLPTAEEARTNRIYDNIFDITPGKRKYPDPSKMSYKEIKQYVERTYKSGRKVHIGFANDIPLNWWDSIINRVYSEARQRIDEEPEEVESELRRDISKLLVEGKKPLHTLRQLDIHELDIHIA